MGLLDFGVGDVVQGAAKIISLFVEDPTEKAKALSKLQDMKHDELMAELSADKEIAVAQNAVNAEEAKSESMFKAGWRPFVGWVCGSAFALNAVVLPLANYGVGLAGRSPIVVPMDTAMIMSVLFGMLGLGGMRSWDKSKGLAK